MIVALVANDELAVLNGRRWISGRPEVQTALQRLASTVGHIPNAQAQERAVLEATCEKFWLLRWAQVIEPVPRENTVTSVTYRPYVPPSVHVVNAKDKTATALSCGISWPPAEIFREARLPNDMRDTILAVVNAGIIRDDELLWHLVLFALDQAPLFGHWGGWEVVDSYSMQGKTTPIWSEDDVEATSAGVSNG